MQNKLKNHYGEKQCRKKGIVKSKIKIVRVNEEEFQLLMNQVISEYDIMKAKELDSCNKSKVFLPMRD